MTLKEITDQINTFSKPLNSGSPTIQQNAAIWLNQLVLGPLYKLRRWWFLHQKVTITTVNGQATYPFNMAALYLVDANFANQPLLVPPIQQATAFYAGSGPPEAVSLVVPGTTGPIPIGVSSVQVFPTPDVASPYVINTSITTPLANLQKPMDHNFMTDQFPMLAIAGGTAVAALAFEEDQKFAQWWSIYVNQVRALAAYDHEVRRGGTMPEPIEPFIPVLSQLIAPQGAGAAAG